MVFKVSYSLTVAYFNLLAHGNGTVFKILISACHLWHRYGRKYMPLHLCCFTKEKTQSASMWMHAWLLI